jgi:hypothetical protein
LKDIDAGANATVLVGVPVGNLKGTLVLTTATQEESQSGFLDIIKLLIAACVLVGGLYGYYYLLEWTLPLRVLLVLGGLIVGVAIAMTSTQAVACGRSSRARASKFARSYGRRNRRPRKRRSPCSSSRW